MDSWCKGSEERVRWQRRIRSHQSPDANSDPGAHAGTDTDSEPDANSGAIGITESDSEPIDDTVGDSDAKSEHESVGTHADSDRDSDASSNAVSDVEPKPDANPGTHAESIDTNFVGNTGTRDHAGTGTPAQAGGHWRRHQRDHASDRAGGPRGSCHLDAPSSGSAFKGLIPLSRGASLID